MNIKYLLFLSGFFIFHFNYAQNYTLKWQQLFIEDADDWTTIGVANWGSEKGNLTGLEGEGLGFAVTKNSYKDFHLKLEFFPDSIVNSGIFFRCSLDSISPLNCYEANIWDNHVNQDFRTGALVRQFFPPLARVETLNKWNTYEIIADGSHIKVWVNGQNTVDFESKLSDEGILALQMFKSGMIKFRNIFIREL